jgi:hypothetical protein
MPRNMPGLSATPEDRFYAAIPGQPTTYELEKIGFEQIRRSMADALKPTESSEVEKKD